MFILLSVMSCSKKIVVTDVFSFHFPTNHPSYIVLNDNDTGELLTYERVAPLGSTFDIELENDEPDRLYNIHFVGRAGDYEEGTVRVLSYRDISPGKVTITEQDSFWYDNKRIQYEPTAELDTFLNGKTHYYHKEGLVELGWQSYSSKFDLVFLKADGDDTHRYHYIEDLSTYEKDSVDIYSLPFVDDYQTVTLHDQVTSGRFITYGRSKIDSTFRPSIYNSDKSDFVTTRTMEYPLVDLPFDYFTSIGARNDEMTYRGFVSGIPDIIEMPKYNFEVSNGFLSDFKLAENDADQGEYVFSIGNSLWYVIDDNSNGSNFVKAEMPEELTSTYLDLLEDGILRSVRLLYLEPENTFSYREMALPLGRVDGYEYGSWNITKGQRPLFKVINLHAF